MDIILEGYKTKITDIHEDSEYKGRYTIGLSVDGVEFESIGVYTKEKIREKFLIQENEFNELLNN